MTEYLEKLLDGVQVTPVEYQGQCLLGHEEKPVADAVFLIWSV